jgi:DNA-binding MarR family transcriptional regulator
MIVNEEDFPDHVLALFGYCMESFRRELLEEKMPAPATGLRASQIRFLSLTPADGMRVTDLADRLMMTKQALGEFAKELEREGFLETQRDPSDGRVRILKPTRKGLKAVDAGNVAIGRVESRWRERLGDDAWDQLRDLLLAAARSAPA